MITRHEIRSRQLQTGACVSAILMVCFLLLPSFVDIVYGDGRIRYAPGFSEVLRHVFAYPFAQGGPGGGRAGFARAVSEFFAMDRVLGVLLLASDLLWVSFLVFALRPHSRKPKTLWTIHAVGLSASVGLATWVGAMKSREVGLGCGAFFWPCALSVAAATCWHQLWVLFKKYPDDMTASMGSASVGTGGGVTCHSSIEFQEASGRGNETAAGSD